MSPIEHVVEINDLLRSLRDAVQQFKEIQLTEIKALKGHQTVDSELSLSQCFSMLERSIIELEETVATIAEATGGRGKL